MACGQLTFRNRNIRPADAGDGEAHMMPTNDRPTGRFFAVMIFLTLTILSLWTASQAAAAANSKLASPAPSLCQISEELFGSKSGADEKAAALSFAQAAVGATDAVANKNIADGNKFQDGLGKVIDGVVACLNASVWPGKQQ